jgi:U3 small nucleolar RNA-associated protein 3
LVATDVEIDDEAAKAEEIEAIRLQRQRAADLDDGDDDDDDNGVFSFPALAEAKKQQKLAEEANAKSTIKGKGSKVTLSSSSSRLHTIEAQPKDMRQLSRQDKLRLIMSEAPELIGLLEDMAIKAKEMKEKISPALEEAKKRNRESENEATLTVTSTKKEAQGDSVLQYLQVRNQLLLTYVIDITFVMLLKAEGRSIRDHPVIAQLVKQTPAAESGAGDFTKTDVTDEEDLEASGSDGGGGGDLMKYLPFIAIGGAALYFFLKK